MSQNQTAFEHRGGARTSDWGVDGQGRRVIQRGIIGQVHIAVVDDTVVGNVARLAVLDDDVVHAWSGGRSWETGEGEGPVGVGEVFVEKAVLRGTETRNKRCVADRCEVGEDSDVLNGGAVGDIAELSRDGDGFRTVTSNGECGNGLIDDFNLLSGWARVKWNPAQIGVAVCTVLLEAHLRPGRSVGGVHGITISGPGASDVAGHLSGRQACKTGHGYKGGVELSARTLLEGLKNVERDVDRTDSS